MCDCEVCTETGCPGESKKRAALRARARAQKTECEEITNERESERALWGPETQEARAI